jgi:hypothetical protein
MIKLSEEVQLNFPTMLSDNGSNEQNAAFQIYGILIAFLGLDRRIQQGGV